MQAAVVSVLLMAGVCGAPPCDSGCANSPAVVQQNCDNSIGGTRWRGDMGDDSFDGPRRDGHGQGGRLWSPVTPNGTVTYEADALGCPRYSPLWLIHWSAKYYPANYATPYDYREAFGYPWNGPRPLPPMSQATWPLAAPMPPPIPELPQAAARGAWPEGTAALYRRQSELRVASKPVLESP